MMGKKLKQLPMCLSVGVWEGTMSHVYKDVWVAAIERGNCRGHYTVAVIKDGVVAGHLPREIFVCFFPVHKKPGWCTCKMIFFSKINFAIKNFVLVIFVVGWTVENILMAKISRFAVTGDYNYYYLVMIVTLLSMLIMLCGMTAQFWHKFSTETLG